MKNMTSRKNALFIAMALGVFSGGISSAQADMQQPPTTGSSSSMAAAVELADKMQTVTGSFEGQPVGHFYYYSFKALRGQNVLFRYEAGIPSVKYEYKENDRWFTLTDPYIFHSLAPGKEVLIRVSKLATATADTSFKFRMGSAPYTAKSSVITTDAQHLRHFENAVQAFRTLDWSVALRDSTGHPVEGAETRLKIKFEIRDDVVGDITTDAEGKGSTTIKLPGCQPSIWSPVYTRPIGPFQYRWVLRYNKHRLTSSIENNPTGPYWKETGLDNVFGHICQEWLVG
jgi:hypothetical protein